MHLVISLGQSWRSEAWCQVQSPGGPPSPELTGRSRAQTLHHLLIEETPRYRPGGEEEQWSELFQGLISKGGGSPGTPLSCLTSGLLQIWSALSSEDPGCSLPPQLASYYKVPSCAPAPLKSLWVSFLLPLWLFPVHPLHSSQIRHCQNVKRDVVSLLLKNPGLFQAE